MAEHDKIEKEWIFKKHKYASGKILDNRLIVSNIKTETLVYESNGIWDSHESYGDEAEDYFPDYIKEGYREAFIFKDYTGYGFYEKDDDPVYNSVELKEYGEEEKAYERAYEVTAKLLRMCPTDNLGVRLNIEKIKNREKWEEEKES